GIDRSGRRVALVHGARWARVACVPRAWRIEPARLGVAVTRAERPELPVARHRVETLARRDDAPHLSLDVREGVIEPERPLAELDASPQAGIAGPLSEVVLMALAVDLGIEIELSVSQRTVRLGIERGEPAARKARLLRKRELAKLARPSVEARRVGGATGDDEIVAVDDEVALRREPADRLGRVGMVAVDETGAIVDPEHATARRIDRGHEHAFERPYTRRHIDGVVGDDGPAAHRPDGDQPAVSENAPRRRSDADLLEDPTVLAGEDPEVAIVRRDEEALAPHRRSDANRSARVDAPAKLSGLAIEGRHAVVAIRADEDDASGSDRLVGGIEAEARIAPRGKRLPEIADPEEIESRRHGVRARAGSAGIEAPLRPVIRRKPGSRRDGDRGEGAHTGHETNDALGGLTP